MPLWKEYAQPGSQRQEPFHFIISGTPAQYLSSKTTFYITGLQGSNCSTYYSY